MLTMKHLKNDFCMTVIYLKLTFIKDVIYVFILWKSGSYLDGNRSGSRLLKRSSGQTIYKYRALSKIHLNLTRTCNCCTKVHYSTVL